MSGRTVVAIPRHSLVVLVGAQKAGKSRLAAQLFAPAETVTMADLPPGADRKDAVVAAAEAVLQSHDLVAVELDGLSKDARREMVALANRMERLPVMIAVDASLNAVERRHAAAGLPFRRGAVAAAIQAVRDLRPETAGYRRFVRIDGEAAEGFVLERLAPPMDRRELRGPFDIFGDPHGCVTELVELMEKLGYGVVLDGDRTRVAFPPGRTPVFLGDLCDRGPGTPGVFRVAMACAEKGGLCSRGNHEQKLLSWLRGHTVAPGGGMRESIEQFARESPAFRARVADFIDRMPSHYWLAGGALAVAHAGIRQSMLGRTSNDVDSFTRYGLVTGETDAETGYPVRLDWAEDHAGPTEIVYGHTPFADAEWVNGTLCVDTGCVFGGALTALRWPEREIVQVKSHKQYYPTKGPLRPRTARPSEETSNAP